MAVRQHMEGRLANGCAKAALYVVRRLRREEGQMTVELCVVLPVAIVIAVVATNALLFFGDCAEFDRVARNAVRVEAAAPVHGEGPGAAASRIQAALDSAMDAENLSCSVSSSKDFRGYEEYTMVLEFSPTLFGLGLRSEVFGVSLPKLTHRSCLCVDPYKPGMLL